MSAIVLSLNFARPSLLIQRHEGELPFCDEGLHFAVALTRKRGTVSLVGLPPGAFPLPIFDVVLKRVTVPDYLHPEEGKFHPNQWLVHDLKALLPKLREDRVHWGKKLSKMLVTPAGVAVKIHESLANPQVVPPAAAMVTRRGSPSPAVQRLIDSYGVEQAGRALFIPAATPASAAPARD